ncbi:toxin-antitoxin system protein [Muribaculum intestinale]|uniref:toxin-antitoxin system protein n=1 Tax=Muribaculum intestinale TaxID=1796646 RepID=UPI002601795D|nr:toxin-antitoxin system protein [Muribaculum intestinale]
MEAAIPHKKATMFRLNIDLIDRLKELARREHRSLNNYVECVLLDAAYNRPNEETIAAINEARKGNYVGDPIDPTSVETLLKSAGI